MVITIPWDFYDKYVSDLTWFDTFFGSKMFISIIKVIMVVLNQLGKNANLGTIPKPSYCTQVRLPKVPKL